MNKKRGEENRFRAFFARLFGDEEQSKRFGKKLFFILLILVESLVLLQRIGAFLKNGELDNLLVAFAVMLTLTISMALQLFVAKTDKGRTIFYITEAVSAALFLFFAGGSYAILVYVLVLTLFYMEMKSYKRSMQLFLFATLFYMSFIGLRMWFRDGEVVRDIVQLIEISYGSILTLVTHFVILQIALAFYRQYLKLDKALTDLDESKKELERAYGELEEVTVLKERQRIAKEIHDTAGHSITTVIMQTESAKRIIDTSPEEAKVKIVAANLQAKHALEELRNSVHLLSGVPENTPLKSALFAIIHESMDGTGINIRSEIENINVNDEQYRFLCNALREGISNGLRHGNATAFWFELKEENGTILFLLSDNGKGVDGKVQMGFGLQAMQDRARALGGDLTVVADIEEGFEFHLEIPVHK